MIEFGDRIAGISYLERPGAYAIIRNDSNAIALVRTHKGYFLPGGGVEPNESFERALQREILEELGYESSILEKFTSATQYIHDKSEDAYFKKVGHFFRAMLTRKVSNPTEPDHQLVWSSPQESLTMFAQEFQAWPSAKPLKSRRSDQRCAASRPLSDLFTGNEGQQKLLQSLALPNRETVHLDSHLVSIHHADH